MQWSPRRWRSRWRARARLQPTCPSSDAPEALAARGGSPHAPHAQLATCCACPHGHAPREADARRRAPALLVIWTSEGSGSALGSRERAFVGDRRELAERPRGRSLASVDPRPRARAPALLARALRRSTSSLCVARSLRHEGRELRDQRIALVHDGRVDAPASTVEKRRTTALYRLASGARPRSGDRSAVAE